MLYLSGCSITPPISGFRPIYPKLTYSSTKPMLNWTLVDSLQPTLKWQSFPGEHQKFLGAELVTFVDPSIGEINDIKYDLKIWTVRELEPAVIEYEIEGIKSPSHTLERPLKPNTEYYWSVRTRFKVNGQPRLSEWSLSQIPCLPSYGFGCARGASRKYGFIPPANYYRFKTP
jgi:hypothetical protein